MRDWEQLVTRIDQEIHRHPNDFIDGRPRPGASARKISETEARLGFSFTPVHREFLAIVDGWPHFTVAESTLYSLDELGSDQWQNDRRAILDWDVTYTEEVESRGMPSFDQMLFASGGFRIGVSMLLVPPASSCADGRMIEIASDINVYDDFYAYMQHVLDNWIHFNEHIEGTS
ncbi:SMI1/KNR4 family protein [Nocardia otitidiscaviarum]|uniref:SMI1/KNR4 family protein n=1 Tax=Nocardia otitidiscaviarum TaxID=1823 RepID=UPI002453CDF7|nr:SMI1/KNR4 family protein [Nocardia otitidiscaviarum]